MEQSVDELLCNANEGTLRNVLAMANIPHRKLIALFEKEKAMARKERIEAIAQALEGVEL